MAEVTISELRSSHSAFGKGSYRCGSVRARPSRVACATRVDVLDMWRSSNGALADDAVDIAFEDQSRLCRKRTGVTAKL